MKKYLKLSWFPHRAFLLISALIMACQHSPDNEAEHSNSFQKDFASAAEVNNWLGRGINLGNALEAPSEGDWGMVIEEHFFELIREAGFQSVRVPIRWNAHTTASYPFKIHDLFFQRVDDVINQALSAGLAVIINIHHFNELMDQPVDQKEKFIQLWKQISERYKLYPEIVLFEILNEPHGSLSPDLWNLFLNDAIRIIRQSNPERVVLAGTAPWGGFGGLNDLALPDDDQVIVTVHYYNPFEFTHQGAEWVENGSEEWLGTTWTATKEQTNAIDTDFNRVSQWSAEHDRPIHLGEFGAYSRAPEESRVLWTEYVRSAAESRSFSWAYWEFGAGFGVYDRTQNKWREELLQALIPSDN